MKQQAFICRAKPDGVHDLSDESLQENCLYYGLPDIANLLDPSHTQESIELAIRAVHLEFKPKREAKMFWIFARTMRKGDIVLTPKRLKDQTVYFIGEVTGDAYHLKEMAASATAYRRPVRWHNSKVALTKADLSEELLAKINVVYNVTKTCLDISEFTDELAMLTQENGDSASQEPINVIRFNEDFDQALMRSLADSSEARLVRLRNASKSPEKRLVARYEFIRNTDVVAETLVRANGRCGKCGNSAPFKRLSDGTPYLEVHHNVPLACGGEDSLDNAIALCPNCHRYMHYGQ
jgi:predicted Mrr-cat superfamily restriction endonuclease